MGIELRDRGGSIENALMAGLGRYYRLVILLMIFILVICSVIDSGRVGFVWLLESELAKMCFLMDAPKVRC